MFLRASAVIVFIISSFSLAAKEPAAAEVSADDTSGFARLWQQSEYHLNFRTLVMSTINEGSLKDDYAMASGLGAGFYSSKKSKWQFGISGSSVAGIFSSDLLTADSLSHNFNRYEAGLFDVQKPGKKGVLFRPEELFVRCAGKKLDVIAGSIKINTPFINPQDGRMNSTLTQAVNLNYRLSEKTKFGAYWIEGISPRSTMRWFSAGRSIGLYSVGVDVHGDKSGYAGKINIPGVSLTQLEFRPKETMRVFVHNMLVPSMLNSSMLEVNMIQKHETGFYTGLMIIHQQAIAGGGNEDYHKTYIEGGAQSNVVSAQVGYKINNWNHSVNYTRITGDGRYLSPREWGRDPFYTFLTRERNEGAGDVNAYVLKSAYTSENQKMKVTGAYGYFDMPDVLNFRLNKYGLPSYHQFNIDALYTGKLKSTTADFHLIAAYKIQAGETYNNPRYIYNKVNMVNISVVVDWKI